MRISHYELFDGGSGQWELIGRFQPRDEAEARKQAETNWSQNRTPTVLTVENLSEDGGEAEVAVIYRSPQPIRQVKMPALDGSIGGRLTMALVNGILIGVVAGVGIGLATGSAGIGLLALLLIGAIASLVMFRMMVPDELMMWRNKNADTKRKTIEALTQAGRDDESTAQEGAGAAPPAPPRRQRRGAFSHPAGQPVAAMNSPQSKHAGGDGDFSDDMNAAPSANQTLQELIATQITTLGAFLSEQMAALGPQASMLQAFDRYGINLYVAGAGLEIAARESLTASTLQSILVGVLVDQNQTAESIRSFCERLDGAQQRPRFKAMMDAGQVAFAAARGGQPIPAEASLVNALQSWSNPHGKTVAGRKFAVLLTDLVGSTEATRKLGNSGAQRMVRAHNAIVREALKQRRGVEAKHTGDGILAVFDKAIDAVEAARQIQQDIVVYTRDNPEIPMLVRIGIEWGEGGVDDSGQFGPAFTAIEATCDAAGAGDIAVSPPVKEQSAGADASFVPLTPSPTAKCFVDGLFKLLWEPKRAMNVPPLEYRQIGTAPKPADP